MKHIREHLLAAMLEGKAHMRARRLEQRGDRTDEICMTSRAKLLRVTQPRVSDVLRGRIDLFSTDSVIDMLARLDVHVRLVLKASRRRQKVA